METTSSPSLEDAVYPSSTPSSCNISQGIINQLAGTKPWVRFISVLVWVSTVFMLLSGASIGLMFVFAKTMLPTSSSPLIGAMAALYIVFAFLYIYPATKLWKYANRIKSLKESHSEIDLEAALNEQRRFWKFIGILCIVMIIIYIVTIIGLGVGVACFGSNLK